MGFSQPELEAMLNNVAADLEIPVLRGLGKRLLICYSFTRDLAY